MELPPTRVQSNYPRSRTQTASRRHFVRQLGLALSLPLACVEPLVPESAFAEPMERTGSDIGSLFSFIQSQAKRDFPRSFLNARFKKLSTWKRSAQARFLDALHYAPPTCRPNPEIVERRDCGGYFQEKIYFNTTPDLRIPAYLLIPKGLRRPAPAILALHDHGAFYFWGKEKLLELEQEHPSLTAFKGQYYAGASIASELARRGYVVIATDMFYWGERRMLLDEDAADWRERPTSISSERIAKFNQRAGQYEALVGRTIFAAGFTWPGIIFWDDLRTVDYLLSRPEVDPQRLGCVGLSVGGFRSCHLAALDSRIKAAVIVGWMTSFPYQLRKHVFNTIGHTMLVPGLYQQLDYPDVCSMAMPAAVLVINGSRDGLFHPEGVRAAFEKLTACYRKAGISEKLRVQMYDGPHEFNREMQALAWEWLQKWV